MTEKNEIEWTRKRIRITEDVEEETEDVEDAEFLSISERRALNESRYLSRRRLPVELPIELPVELPINLDDFKYESYTMLEQTSNGIIEEASANGIYLKGFSYISAQQRTSNIEKYIFKTASEVLVSLIEAEELPKFIRERELTQLMLDGKAYLKKGDSGFEEAKKRSYGGIIYDMFCDLPFSLYSSLSGLHYIGRTHKSLFKRMKGHTENSLTSVENTRLIEQAIIAALELEGYDIELLRIEYEALIPWMKDKLLENLTEILLEKYFKMEIIEVHNNYHSTPAREKWYIINYRHYVNGVLTIGTKNPKGLNMTENTGSTKNYIALPLYDMAFLLALGYSEGGISDILNNTYALSTNNFQIGYRIRDFFESFINAQILFMRPVVVEILTNFPSIELSELSRAFGYNRFGNGQYSIFRKFFEGLNFVKLRNLMRRPDFDWDNLKELAKEFKDVNKIKGFSKSKWIKWLIKDIPNMKICEKIGLNPKDSHVAQKSIDYILNNSEIGMSKRIAVKYFRRLETIEYKLKRQSLKWIYTTIFGLKVGADWSIKRFHDRLWKSVISFEKLNDMDNPNELLNLKLKIA